MPLIDSTQFNVVLTGTGAAFPPMDRENTSLALTGDDGLMLVDCGASPHRRLRLAGLDPGDLDCVLITHHHPDHLYGLPSLIHCLIPTPRNEPLVILAPPAALSCARQVLDAFDLLKRKEVPLSFIEIPMVFGFEYAVEGLHLSTAPVNHSLDCIGLRVEAGDRIIAYSADTAPCEELNRLASGAHLLVHESTFRESDRGQMSDGHSTARDAGITADLAGVETLLLVHFLESTLSDPESLKMEAKEVFSGRVEIGEDLGWYIV